MFGIGKKKDLLTELVTETHHYISRLLSSTLSISKLRIQQETMYYLLCLAVRVAQEEGKNVNQAVNRINAVGNQLHINIDLGMPFKRRVYIYWNIQQKDLIGQLVVHDYLLDTSNILKRTLVIFGDMLVNPKCTEGFQEYLAAPLVLCDIKDVVAYEANLKSLLSAIAYYCSKLPTMLE